MINCGIIGFGKMGKIRAKAIEKSGKGRINAIYDINNPNKSQTAYDDPNLNVTKQLPTGMKILRRRHIKQCFTLSFTMKKQSQKNSKNTSFYLRTLFPTHIW